MRRLRLKSKILRRASFRSSRSHQILRQRKHALPVKFIVSHKKETLIQSSTGFLQSAESLTIIKKTNRYSSTNFLLQLQRVFYSSNLVGLLLRCSRQLRKQLRSELLSNYEEPHWNWSISFQNSHRCFWGGLVRQTERNRRTLTSETGNRNFKHKVTTTVYQ